MWVSTEAMRAAAGVPSGRAKAVAAWLPAPGEPDYTVVLFFDPDSLWSTTALYNASRLSPVTAAG
jgi:hypothetical protein